MIFFREKQPEKSQKIQTPKILPFDVRFALEHREARLNKEDIELLAKSGFENEAIYLSLKAVNDSREENKILLEEYIDTILDSKSEDLKAYKIELSNLVSSFLKDKEDISVEGKKLAQISRYGEDLVSKTFEEESKKLKKSDKKVFLVASSMFLGLRQFVKNFSEVKKDLHIINPEWIKKDFGEKGYKIKFDDSSNFELSFLDFNFEGVNSVVVDDTENTGRKFSEIKDFWVKNKGVEPECLPLFKSK